MYRTNEKLPNYIRTQLSVGWKRAISLWRRFVRVPSKAPYSYAKMAYVVPLLDLRFNQSTFFYYSKLNSFTARLPLRAASHCFNSFDVQI